MPRGRKPTPTKILLLRGSRRAKQRQGEVHPPVASIEAPSWLSDKGKQHWNETAPRLAASGLLTTLDVHTWALACRAWALAIELSELIARDGLVLTNEDGSGRMHPAIRMESKWFELYLKIAGEFGATPRGRVGLAVQKIEDDPLEAFLAGKTKPGEKDKARFFKHD
jgi:P27 family predicted phage terminase small subunit